MGTSPYAFYRDGKSLAGGKLKSNICLPEQHTAPHYVWDALQPKEQAKTGCLSVSSMHGFESLSDGLMRQLIALAEFLNL